VTASSILVAALAAAAPAAEPAPSACARMLHAVEAGALLAASDVAPAECGGRGPAPAFRYEPASGAARAVRALAAEEIVPAVPAAALVAVRPGEPLILAVRRGAVTLNRTVTALQPARPGQKLFVRAADGRVFAVRYAEPGQ